MFPIWGKYYGIGMTDAALGNCTNTIPCFGLLVTSLGFKARVGNLICRGICDIHSLRFTSGATPLQVYMASTSASHLQTCMELQPDALTTQPLRRLASNYYRLFKESLILSEWQMVHFETVLISYKVHKLYLVMLSLMDKKWKFILLSNKYYY